MWNCGGHEEEKRPVRYTSADIWFWAGLAFAIGFTIAAALIGCAK